MTTTTILSYIILGSLGIFYIMFARTQGKAVALFSGIGFSVIPYFTMNLWIIIPVTIIFLLLTFFFTI